jgi:hypothetical protein
VEDGLVGLACDPAEELSLPADVALDRHRVNVTPSGTCERLSGVT